MNIIYDENLRKALEKSDKKNIVVNAMKKFCWGGTTLSVTTRLVGEKEKFDPELYMEEKTDIGSVFLSKRGVTYEDEVKLIYNKMLWGFRVLVEGVK